MKANVKYNSNDDKIVTFLDREEINFFKIPSIKSIFDKTILVTGAAGSIGAVLCKHIIDYKPKKLLLLDLNEDSLHHLSQDINRIYNIDVEIIPINGNITHQDFVEHVFAKHFPETVFHLSGYKNVSLMEKNKESAILNNFIATEYLSNAANMFKTETFIFVSSIQAVNPISIVGMTKRLSELLLLYLNQKSATNYISVRLCNVFHTIGDVGQLFKSQIEKGGPITITQCDMNRYFMSLREAVSLILYSCIFGGGEGEIYLLNVGQPINITDLAVSLVKKINPKVFGDLELRIIGARPGEKISDELKYDYENRTITHHPQITKLSSPDIDSSYFSKQLILLDEDDLEKTFTDLYASLKPVKLFREKL